MQVCLAVNEDRQLLISSGDEPDAYDADADSSTEVVFAHNNASFKRNFQLLRSLLHTCHSLVKLVC